MCVIRWWKICAHFHIAHQEHFSARWKIWILCHMCAYQNNNMIFQIFEVMQISQTHNCTPCKPHVGIKLQSSLSPFQPHAKLWGKLQHDEFFVFFIFHVNLGINKKCCNFENSTINLKSPWIHYKFMVAFLNGVWHICIASKIWIILKSLS